LGSSEIWAVIVWILLIVCLKFFDVGDFKQTFGIFRSFCIWENFN
jgi:hypothetical protein